MLFRSYCTCRRVYSGEWMIACDGCEGWFHPSCVGSTRAKLQSLASYLCPPCRAKQQQQQAPTSSADPNRPQDGALSRKSSSTTLAPLPPVPVCHDFSVTSLRREFDDIDSEMRSLVFTMAHRAELANAKARAKAAKNSKPSSIQPDKKIVKKRSKLAPDPSKKAAAPKSQRRKHHDDDDDDLNNDDDEDTTES